MSKAPEARAALRQRLRAAARAAWEAGLRRADPRAAFSELVRLEPGALRAGPATLPLKPAARVVVLGMGKAVLPLVEEAVALLGGRVSTGLAVTKDGHAAGRTHVGPVRVVEAAHPVPDERGARAAGELLDLARSVRPPDVALVLVTGGGSALTARPVPGLDLADLAATTKALLDGGADIHAANAVRRHLSAVHGGRLAQALGPTRSLALVVSDVPGDDLAAVASGPTVRDPSTWADVARALAAPHVAPRVPRAVRDAVAEGLAGRRRGPPGKADVDWHRHAAVLLTGNAEAVAAAAAELDRLGFPPAEGRPTVTGPVEAAAEDLVAAVRAAARVGPASVAWGGETTLVVRGPGRGGRNQHLAALAARRLASLAAGAPAGALGPARLDECAAGGDVEIVVAAIGTDGTDGPTDAAGGLVDAGTWNRASAAGVDPDRALAELDSHALLAGSGDLVVTGPTGTNVMDLYLAVAAPVAEGA